MSETAHTPGPWKADRNYGPEWSGLSWHIMDVNDDFIATLFCWPEPRQAANARLMAAAPELLEALLALVAEARVNMRGGKGHLLDDAYAAIAKAEGRS